MFFQHENRFRYKFFDIVQFSRSCSASTLRLTTRLFYHRSDFLSSSFFEVFRDSDLSVELGAFSVSRRWPELSDVYWFFSLCFPAGTQKSFFCLSAWRSSIIPYAGPLCKPFLQVFLLFFRFCIHPLVFCLKSVPALTPVQHACGVLPLPVGGAVILYNKKSICCLHRANGCSLLYIIVTSGHTPV